MSRFVCPYLFTLRASRQVEAARQQKSAAVRDRLFPRSDGLIPIALRWSTHPDLGFSREPFQVFRRGRQRDDLGKAVSTTNGALPVSGESSVSTVANGDAAYIVMASVILGSGQSLKLEARDATERVIPGQVITLSANGVAQFRHPGITSLRVTGSGTVSAVRAVGQDAYANFPDWERIQMVGLPFRDGEAGTSYRTLKQGFEPPALDGLSAAQMRTLMTATLQLQPNASGIPDFPVPPFPPPDPKVYVDYLRSSRNLGSMALRCLTQTNDADPAHQQADFTESVDLDGIKQANLPGATADPNKTTKAVLPVTALAALAVSTDSFSAVGMGYGTVDIPPSKGPASPPTAVAVIGTPTLPPTDPNGVWDYMVTGPFQSPFGKFTLAALSAGQLPVETATGLTAAVKQKHTPLHRDGAAPAAIKVSWQTPRTPQSYGIVVSRKPGTSEVLNTKRPPQVQGYDPFFGVPPSGDSNGTPPDLINPGFTDTEALLPLRGLPVGTRYLVAGIDVFGLWSTWAPAAVALAPAPVLQPGVRAAKFLLDTAHATGHVVPATLQIDFGWDWEDRSPSAIRITGQFVGAPAAGLGPAGAGLQMKTGVNGLPAVLSFSYANPAEAASVQPSLKVPTIDANHTLSGGVTVLKTADFNPDAPPVTYRAEIRGFTLDFTSVTEIDFALYVSATESIRPTEWSAANDAGGKPIGALVRTFDPFPPAVKFTPPAISWTALPDTTGAARGVLTWAGDSKAAGYYVWEATESALTHLLAPNDAPLPPETPMVARGTKVKQLVQNQQAASLQGFARLNRDPIPGTQSQTEIVLPGAASTLYLYRISAISAGNVEAARSDEVAIFGVPRRNVPGTPRMMLRPAKAPQSGLQVIALPVESGGKPSGYRVFRVRNQALSQDGSTMGPAKISDTAPGWTAYSGTSLAGKQLTGKSILDTAAVTSWYPYFYRVKAIGLEDKANGLLSGESDFSAAQTGYVLPQTAPLLLSWTKSTNSTGALVTLVTDLPAAAASPVGPALVEVLQLTTVPASPKPVTTVVLSAAPDQIAIGTLTLPRGIFPLPIGQGIREPIAPSSLPHVPVISPVPENLVSGIHGNLKDATHANATGVGTSPVVAAPLRPVGPVGPVVVTPIDPVGPVGLPPIRPFPPLHPLPPHPALRRSAPDAAGRWTLYVLLPYTAAQAGTFMLRLTDPLGRQTLQSF